MMLTSMLTHHVQRVPLDYPLSTVIGYSLFQIDADPLSTIEVIIGVATQPKTRRRVSGEDPFPMDRFSGWTGAVANFEYLTLKNILHTI